jgi:hypothetical protein
MKKFLFGAFISAFLLGCSNEKKEEATASTEPTTATATTPEAKKTGDEILDMSETEGVKKGLIAFSKGDIEGMTADYADTVLHLWSALDSLRGKKAVQDYYKSRWTLIDSLNFSDHILLPLKANVQQTMYAPTGKWVLAWSFAHVKYKNGKKLNFWVHNAYHYNDANKIDLVGQYLDRDPIVRATKSK